MNHCWKNSLNDTKKKESDGNALYLDPKWDRTIFVILLYLVTLAIVYWPSFEGSWHYDDYINIVRNKNIQIRSLDSQSIFNSFYLEDSRRGGRIKRPLAYLSFAINYYFGKDHVQGYHIVNFFIHLLSSCFLYLFIRNTLYLPLLKPRYGYLAHQIAMLSAFIWAIHPIHVTAVTYIVQRMASMAGMFYLMSLYFYSSGRMTKGTIKKVFRMALFGLAALGAMATKENSTMLPVSVALYEILLIRGGNRFAWKKAVAFLLPTFLSLANYIKLT